MHTEFWWGNSRERSVRRLEDNIKVDLKKWDGGLDLMNLAGDRDRWRAFVNAEMNLRVL